jgi:hypothetical protein
MRRLLPWVLGALVILVLVLLAIREDERRAVPGPNRPVPGSSATP